MEDDGNEEAEEEEEEEADETRKKDEPGEQRYDIKANTHLRLVYLVGAPASGRI